MLIVLGVLVVCFVVVLLVSFISSVFNTGLIKYDDVDERGYYEKMNDSSKQE